MLLNQNIIISAFCIRTANAFNVNVYINKMYHMLTNPGLSPPGNLVMNCNSSEKPDSFTQRFRHSQLMPPAMRPKSLRCEIRFCMNVYYILKQHKYKNNAYYLC